jgi:molecular chaperone GrpE
MTEQTHQTVELDPSDDELDSRAQAERAATSDAGPVAETDDIQTVRAERDAAREQAAANYDRFLRSRADMDNYKRRLERTYADLARNSKKMLLQKLLNVKDNLERALQYAESSQAQDGIAEGVRLTKSQLDQLLAQEDVRPIQAEGKPFNPRLHEAVQTVHDPNVPDHQVVQVVRNGYIYGENDDEVLRPAQVVVNVHEGDRAQ